MALKTSLPQSKRLFTLFLVLALALTLLLSLFASTSSVPQADEDDEIVSTNFFANIGELKRYTDSAILELAIDYQLNYNDGNFIPLIIDPDLPGNERQNVATALRQNVDKKVQIVGFQRRLALPLRGELLYARQVLPAREVTQQQVPLLSCTFDMVVALDTANAAQASVGLPGTTEAIKNEVTKHIKDVNASVRQESARANVAFRTFPEAKNTVPLTDSMNRIDTALDGLERSGDMNLGIGINAAHRILSESSRELPKSRQYILLISSGRDNPDDRLDRREATWLAQQARRDATIIAIQLGDGGYMRRLASKGHFHKVDNKQELEQTLRRITRDICVQPEQLADIAVTLYPSKFVLRSRDEVQISYKISNFSDNDAIDLHIEQALPAKLIRTDNGSSSVTFDIDRLKKNESITRNVRVKLKGGE